MSSVTDPYVPQEKSQEITRSVLLEMLERPPDVLVIQTHATLIERDIDIIDAALEALPALGLGHGRDGHG